MAVHGCGEKHLCHLWTATALKHVAYVKIAEVQLTTSQRLQLGFIDSVFANHSLCLSLVATLTTMPRISLGYEATC